MKRVSSLIVVLVIAASASFGTPTETNAPLDGARVVLAAATGERDYISVGIAIGIDLNGMYRYENRLTTPLIAAAEMGNVEVVEMLIERDACVDLRDSRQWSALMYAAKAGHTEVARILLDAGAHTGLRCPETGLTAEQLAVAAGFAEVAQLIGSNRG